MLKIIRVNYHSNKLIQVAPRLISLEKSIHFSHKDDKIRVHTYTSFASGHMCAASSSFSKKLLVTGASRNILTTNSIDLSVSKSTQLQFLSQKRNFSLQSSIQSLAATQSGIFKTISESTPVEYCQQFLLFVHDLTGLPWWASIILSTIIIRSVVTLPLAIYQQTIVARLENLKLELPEIANELKKETALAIHLYNWDEKIARATYNRSIRKQWNNLIVRDNCHPLKTTVLLWVQIPLWISVSVSLRNLVYMLPVTDVNSQLTFAELMVGGFGFMPNLTIPDFSWIFPVALGIFNLAIIEIQMLSKDPNVQISKVQKFFTNAFRVISIFMVPIAASVPSCLVLYWTSSSAYGLAQNLILMSPKVKRFCRIPETVVEVKEPYKMLVTNFKYKFKLV